MPPEGAHWPHFSPCGLPSPGCEKPLGKLVMGQPAPYQAQRKVTVSMCGPTGGTGLQLLAYRGAAGLGLAHRDGRPQRVVWAKERKTCGQQLGGTTCRAGVEPVRWPNILTNA